MLLRSLAHSFGFLTYQDNIMGIHMGFSCNRKKFSCGKPGFSCSQKPFSDGGKPGFNKEAIDLTSACALPDVNPNPYKFSIIEREYHKDIRTMTIALVNYPNCTTFHGDKLLLIRGRLKENPTALDPHFLDGDHPVIARFLPTEDGLNLARLCAKNEAARA